MKTSVEIPVGDKTGHSVSSQALHPLREKRLEGLVEAHLPTLSTLPRLTPPVDPVVSHNVGLKHNSVLTLAHDL